MTTLENEQVCRGRSCVHDQSSSLKTTLESLRQKFTAPTASQVHGKEMGSVSSDLLMSYYFDSNKKIRFRHAAKQFGGRSFRELPEP